MKEQDNASQTAEAIRSAIECLESITHDPGTGGRYNSYKDDVDLNAANCGHVQMILDRLHEALKGLTDD